MSRNKKYYPNYLLPNDSFAWFHPEIVTRYIDLAPVIKGLNITISILCIECHLIYSDRTSWYLLKKKKLCSELHIIKHSIRRYLINIFLIETHTPRKRCFKLLLALKLLFIFLFVLCLDKWIFSDARNHIWIFSDARNHIWIFSDARNHIWIIFFSFPGIIS